ncbi:MAG: hypothetical protein ABIJ56_17445 [Pseudomonadota bacterium]
MDTKAGLVNRMTVLFLLCGALVLSAPGCSSGGPSPDAGADDGGADPGTEDADGQPDAAPDPDAVPDPDAADQNGEDGATCDEETCAGHCRSLGYEGGTCTDLACQCGSCPSLDPLAGAAELRPVGAEAGGTLLRAYPPGGGDKDSILFAVLQGDPYSMGYQHGLLLADMAADVIVNRYSCPEVTPQILEWMEDAYERMPGEFREEIRGLADGLAEKGQVFDMGRIVMHAAQVFAPPRGQFPWFNCPWEEDSGDPGGSFSYAAWGDYAAGGGTLMIGSPDWGAVPPSMARNRVIFSVRPTDGFRHVFLGVAGVIGLTGMNETGVAVAGTAGQRCAAPVTPMPGNGIPVPEGFMSLVLISRYVLTHFSANEEDSFGRLESEILAHNPVDGFITHMTLPGRSALWEPGATASPEYPYNSRREAGEWDDGSITPVDFRGELVLTQAGVFSTADLDFHVEYEDSVGEPYAGTATFGGVPITWRRWHLGQGLVLPDDPGRAGRFEAWAAALETAVSRPVPSVLSDHVLSPAYLVSAAADGSGGFWTDGIAWGSWSREGDSFHAVDSAGAEICSGPLYDFGVGVTGWCDLGGDDLEVVAWTYDLPSGSGERLDGMNLTVLPQLKPWALAGSESGFWERGPHSRTHLALRFLGGPDGDLTLGAFYDVFQKAYLALGGENASFGVGQYDLVSRQALLTVSRYEGEQFIGALNPVVIPVLLDCRALFGYE